MTTDSEWKTNFVQNFIIDECICEEVKLYIPDRQTDYLKSLIQCIMIYN